MKASEEFQSAQAITRNANYEEDEDIERIEDDEDQNTGLFD